MSPNQEDLPIAVVSPAGVASRGIVLAFAVRDERVVAVGGQGRDLLLTSADGKTWKEGRSNGQGLRGACIRENGELWVIGEYGYLARSSDFGASWTKVPTKTSGCLFGVVEDDDGKMWFGGDEQWLAISKGEGDELSLKRLKDVKESIARMRNSPLGVLIPTDTSESDGYLYIASGKKAIRTSAAPKAGMMQAVVTPKGTLIAVGMKGAIVRSTDAPHTDPTKRKFKKIALPESVTSPKTRMLTNVDCFDDGRVVVVGAGGLILISHDDGETFETIKQSTSRGILWCCARYGSAMLIGGEDGLVMMLGELKHPPLPAVKAEKVETQEEPKEAPRPARPHWAAPPPSTAKQIWTPPSASESGLAFETRDGIYVTDEFRSFLYQRRGGIKTIVRPVPTIEEAWGELRRLLWAADRAGMTRQGKERASGIWERATSFASKGDRLFGLRLLDVEPRKGTLEEDAALVEQVLRRYNTFIADFHNEIYDALTDFLVASVGVLETIPRLFYGLDDELPHSGPGPFGRLRDLLGSEEIVSDDVYASARQVIVDSSQEAVKRPGGDTDRTADTFWAASFLLPLDKDPAKQQQDAIDAHERALKHLSKFGNFYVHPSGIGSGDLATLERYRSANGGETRHEFFSPFNGRMYLASILEIEGAASTGPILAAMKPSYPWTKDERHNTLWCRLIAHIEHDAVLEAMYAEHQVEEYVWGRTGLVLAARSNPDRVLAFAKKKGDKNLLAILEDELSHPAPPAPSAVSHKTDPGDLVKPVGYTPPKTVFATAETSALLEPEATWREEEVTAAQEGAVYDDAIEVDGVSLRKASPEAVEAWLSNKEKWALPASIEDFSLAPRKAHPRLLKLGFAPQSYYVGDGLSHVMHRGGFDLLPLLEATLLHGDSWEEALPVAQPFGDVAFAPAIARAFAGKKNKSEARTWMLRHPRHAIGGALLMLQKGHRGDANKKDEKVTAADAERMLRYLDGRGHRDAILELASSPSLQMRPAIQEMLDADPLDAPKVKAPVLPKWAKASDLPALAVASAKAKATPEEVDALLKQLAFSNADEVHPGVIQAKKKYTAESRAQFAWQLFETWLSKKADAKQIWCMHAVGFLGDDECARKLTALAKVWPGEKASARAQSALDTLLNIGTDAALININLLAEKSKFPAFKAAARERIDTIAYGRGLTADELADRLVPTLGLEEDNARTLDFGSRSFEIVFGEDLLPKVKDGSGKIHPDLPKPNKSDDKDLAKEAKTKFSALKKDARTTSSLQITRMERAMRTTREISADVFTQCFATHPWMSHLARRFVWGAYENGGQKAAEPPKTFRISEDGTLANIDEKTFKLAKNSVVVLLHPLAIPANELNRWGQIFGDYEILQPFQQLSRPTYAIDEKERTAKEIDRFKGRKVAHGALRGLESRGWERWNDDSVQMVRRVSAKSWVVIETEPGWHPSQTGDEIEPQSIECLRIVTAIDPNMRNDEDTTKVAMRGFGDLSPLAFSELIYDLETITASQPRSTSA